MKPKEELILRYLVLVHSEPISKDKIEEIEKSFAK
jgi:hypothetical protein